MRVGTTLTYLHSDHLGSASLATNTSGGIEWQARYKPFGETRWTSGTLTTNRKFNGMKEEASLGGIYDFNARMYDPAIGRFLSADTIVPRPSDPQSLNRYAFVFNNPLGYIDRDGHVPIVPFLLLSVGAGVANAVVNTGTYYLGKVAANSGDFSKTTLSVSEVAVTAGVGFGVGALTPVAGLKTGLPGIMGLNGIGNTVQYFLINKVTGQRSTVSGAAAALGFGVIGGLAGGKLGPSSAIANQRQYVSLLKFYRSSLTKDIENRAVVDDAIALLSSKSLGSSTVSGGITNILQSIPGVDSLNQQLLEFLATLDEGALQKWIDENINDIEESFEPVIIFSDPNNDPSNTGGQ
jgi:RHS repeat-associated protein